jgi:hypothetical protein
MTGVASIVVIDNSSGKPVRTMDVSTRSPRDVERIWDGLLSQVNFDRFSVVPRTADGEVWSEN